MLEAAADFRATEEDWSRLSELVARRCGLTFSASRRRWLEQAVERRVRDRGWAGAAVYHDHLVHHPDGAAEWDRLLESLLNGETRFFRHLPSFEALVGRILPELWTARSVDGYGRLRLWSAGCSFGQEAYSLAMAAREWGERVGADCRVVGSDLSGAAIARCVAGRYKELDVDGAPPAYRRRYLARRSSELDGVYEVAPAIRSMTTFQRFNLLDPATYKVPPQDVVFCQNVLIYFAASARDEVARLLGERLRPGGYLLFAPTDALELRPRNLEPVRLEHTLVFRRRDR